VTLMMELSTMLTLDAATAVVGVLESTWLVEIRGMWYLVVGILPRTESKINNPYYLKFSDNLSCTLISLLPFPMFNFRYFNWSRDVTSINPKSVDGEKIVSRDRT
jgi:hypothetical protein